MPLSDPSKPKVSLASLSATTAAAAESLWSRSKKSTKKKSSSSNNIHLNNKEDPVPAASAPVDPEAQLHQQALESHEFRKRFLEGLQFYCENSSLILNSDLPADLIEYVTCHGFSVEALGIILELKKSSSAFSSVVDKKTVAATNTVLEANPSTDKLTRDQNFSEVSRRLLQHWMSADSCAEAFVSLSLGEEIPGLIAECASFQRLLFTIPDCFQIANKDFLNFLLTQILLAVCTLAHGIRISAAESAEVNVKTQAIASILDRVLLRYFSDNEYFYSLTTVEELPTSFQDNPFLKFVAELAAQCREDLIARRLFSKIILHLSSHSALKFAKVVFCYNEKNSSTASTLLYPATEFLDRNSQWKLILQTLPVKTVTFSKRFWLNWATFIEKESNSCDIFWRNCVDHWIVLNKSSLVDEHSLLSSTLAVVALARQIKQNRIVEFEASEETAEFIQKLNPTNVLQNVVHSLESINENKKACGMALAEVVADLQFSLPTAVKDADAPKSLKFESRSARYIEILEFFKYGIHLEENSSKDGEHLLESDTVNSRRKDIQVLDSDDDVEEESVEAELDDDGFPLLGESAPGCDSEINVDPRLRTLRARKRKIPMYFSEIVEVLLEGSKNEDEAQILKCIVVLKIPVLICSGVKIDAKMCATISRCLVDIEDEKSLQIPVLLALYELHNQHPFTVADLIGDLVFDKDHYSLGQRLMNLNRLLQIMLISSKQSCFTCYSSQVAKFEKELLGIYPEFINKYLNARKKVRYCQQCRSNEPKSTSNESFQTTPTQKDETLTWKQIVDRRVAAKTKYFVTPKGKNVVTVPDEYSSKLVPVLWSTIANRLTCKTGFYLDNDIRVKSGSMHDVFLVNVFQYLGKCIFGTSGPNCPHFRHLASHAGELVINFVHHEDANVRRSALSLLGIVLHVGEGKMFVIEALSTQQNVLKKVDILLSTEKDPENRKLLASIQNFLAGCTAAGMLRDIVNIE